jgi:serine protease Do
MKSMNPLRWVLFAGFLSACLGTGLRSESLPATLEPVASTQESGLAIARSLSQTFQAIAHRAQGAVVSVRVFDSGGRRRTAQGSGVIVSEDGLIITNNHVVADGNLFLVRLDDERELEARLIGTDPLSDLAVLRIDERNLDPLPLSRIREPSVGELVLAVGNPLGLGLTVTSGIVSGVGRADLNVATYEDFIQTDATINPGNSGGPLLNLDGEVIGINTAVGGYAMNVGYGFAIPSRMVRTVLDNIVETGYVRRGWLGVSVADLSNRDAERIGFPGRSRVAVTEVIDDTPAERAGLRQDDVIVSIAGSDVYDRQDLLEAIAAVKPGTRVDIDLWRDGRSVTLPVTLAERGERIR